MGLADSVHRVLSGLLKVYVVSELIRIEIQGLGLGFRG